MKLYLLFFILFGSLVLTNGYEPLDTDHYLDAQRSCFYRFKPPFNLSTKYLLMNFPKDESSDCYIQCLLEIWNFYIPTNGLSVIEVTKQASHLFPKFSNEIRESLELCMKKFPEEGDKYRSCTWIGNVFKCFLKNYRKVFFLSFNIQELPCIQAPLTDLDSYFEEEIGTLWTLKFGSVWLIEI